MGEPQEIAQAGLFFGGEGSRKGRYLYTRCRSNYCLWGGLALIMWSDLLSRDTMESMKSALRIGFTVKI
jgi:hypothetical protein